MSKFKPYIYVSVEIEDFSLDQKLDEIAEKYGGENTGSGYGLGSRDPLVPGLVRGGLERTGPLSDGSAAHGTQPRRATGAPGRNCRGQRYRRRSYSFYDLSEARKFVVHATKLKKVEGITSDCRLHKDDY